MSELEALQDEAVQDSIEKMEATGQEICCDGEQRWSSFATYPITDTMTGTSLVDTLADGGQIFALFPDGHYRTCLSVALRHEQGMFSICFLYGGHGYGVQGGIAGARIE